MNTPRQKAIFITDSLKTTYISMTYTIKILPAQPTVSLHFVMSAACRLRRRGVTRSPLIGSFGISGHGFEQRKLPLVDNETGQFSGSVGASIDVDAVIAEIGVSNRRVPVHHYLAEVLLVE
jgi:hypothetical protein